MKNPDVFAVIINDGGYARERVLGRELVEYVETGLTGLPHTLICGETPDIPAKFDYLAVIYGDMGLLTADILYDAARLMKGKNLKKVSVGRGFMCSYAGIDVELPQLSLNFTEFLSVTDANSLKVVYNELRERIIARAVKGGALITDNAAIDDTAVIEAGAEIIGDSRITGNSVISGGAKIICSIVENSVIESGETVGPYAYVSNGKILNGYR